MRSCSAAVPSFTRGMMSLSRNPLIVLKGITGFCTGSKWNGNENQRIISIGKLSVNVAQLVRNKYIKNGAYISKVL